MTRLVTSARCLLTGCLWTFTETEGDPDLEARRHTGEALKGGPVPAHPTVTWTVPAGTTT